MPLVYGFTGYNTRISEKLAAVRYPALDDYRQQIEADNGYWQESEIFGDIAIFKLRASLATIALIRLDPKITIAKPGALDAPLSSLTNAERTALRNVLTNAGFTLAEIVAALPNLANVTFGQFLKFAVAKGRRDTTLNPITNTYALTGPLMASTPIEFIDLAVQEVSN